MIWSRFHALPDATLPSYPGLGPALGVLWLVDSWTELTMSRSEGKLRFSGVKTKLERQG